MKKIIIGALAAVMAIGSLASVAQAEGRDRGDNWRRDRDGRQHQSWRHDDRRDDRWRHNNGWRHDGWRHDRWRGGYWGGPSIVIRPGYYNDYCFIKKVRRYDDWGNVYIKRVRVCR
jgi:Ni/Co efflux regulator RcnB